MTVRVDEAGGGCAPVQIDGVCALRRHFLHFLVGSNRDDLPAGDAHRFGDGVLRVNGQNPAVEQDEIGFGATLSVHEGASAEEGNQKGFVHSVTDRMSTWRERQRKGYPL